ncbi:MAG TPA: AAA family ATPase [Polyangia bacterium]|nr:AAA family ATPase [Polyangia bacterium]
MGSGLRDHRFGDFRGTDRFVVQRRLGAGAMGVVYQAFDRERSETIALKTIRNVDAAAIYRFKQEFRALTDVTHPNLVALHELVSLGEQWFFTMELVEGVDFLAFVREGAEVALAETITDFSGALVKVEPRPLIPARTGVALPLPGAHMGRLRAALLQLAEGVYALHQAGKLHRDIKPSNVLVTRSGRVVLLDFGLVTDLAPHGRSQNTERDVVGTAAYMAPEQGANLQVSEATDWYAVGVILYEALTGRLPFVGGVVEVLVDKQKFEPPAPRELSPEVPEDLNALCVELLRRLPEARPSGRDVLRRLGARTSALELPALSRSWRSQSGLLVGRERHLQTLSQAFARTQEGRAVAVHVHGPSGMGKSALVQSFIDQIEESAGPVVLSGRCYERESVPYKALDSLVDSLSRHLSRLADREAAPLVPRDAPALARLFPVLRRVGVIADAPRRGVEAADPQELRRRAFAALRELLAGLAAKGPVVLFIDDVQWGDVDSAALLAELLRPPEPPPLLLLLSYRSEDAQSSPFLRELERPKVLAAADLEVHDIEVGPLLWAEARAQALSLLGASLEDARAREDAERIATESGGSPFFVDELVRHLQAGALLEGRVSLGKMLQARLHRLPPEARRLLDVVAIAGRPLAQAVAARAAELGAEDRQALSVLRAGHLVRTRGVRDRDEIEAYHDRIREAAVALLAASDQRDCHRRLAVALEGSERADPEAMALHWRGAGETERAAEYAEVAAAKAEQALAFDRAARLYALALELRPPDYPERRELRAAMAQALANAGHGTEAAEAYLEAAVGAKEADALEYQRRAAEHLMRCGHIDRGMETLRRVVAAADLELPRTPRRALMSLLSRRLRLKLRGLRFREHDSTQISPRELRRIDICFSMASVLSKVDTIRGADFQTKNLLLALEAGEPFRVARALAAEAGYSATAGGRSRERTAALVETARVLAQKVGHPLALALVTIADGLAAVLEGRWKYGRARCQEAEQKFRDHYVGIAWEVASIQQFALWALGYLGELEELSRQVPACLKEARERADLNADTNLRIGRPSLAWLAADDPEGARREVAAAMEKWSQQGFHLQHYYELYALCNADLYVGAGAAALARLRERWPALAGSLCLRIQLTRLEARALRGRALLAAAGGGGAADKKRLLGAALRDAHALERERMPWADPLALLLRAGAAALDEKAEAASALLVRAAAGFDAADMALHAAVARRRLGELSEGTSGAELVAAADAWMSTQKVRNPARMAALIAPGLGAP